MKIIFVTFNGGRCGSSAMIGTLAQCGVDVGNVSLSKSVENPEGFYEVKEYQKFNTDVYKEHLTPQGYPEEPKLMRDRPGKKKILMSIINRNFRYDTIAVKAMGFCPLPLLEKTDIDIKVICLSRNVYNQSKSIQKMWYGKRTPKQDFIDWLNRCNVWVKDFKKEYNFNYLDVSFEDLLTKTDETVKEVCAFCGIKYNKKDVCAFINKDYSRSGIK